MASPTERTELMVRQRNSTASAIMRTIVRDGPLGRKELSSVTGVSFTTITKTVTELLALGALTESAPPAPRGAGRPVTPLDVPSVRRLVLGGHLHPESTSCGAYTLRGDLVTWRSAPASGRTERERIEEAAELVDAIVTEVGTAAVTGIGMTTPWAELHHGQPPPLVADVDPDALHTGLREHLSHPVRVEPNVRAQALEHYWWGGGGNDVLTVLVGRSVGVAQMRGGDLVWDGPGAGGLVSHVVVPGSTYPCDCGQVGCVKATCTDDALLRRAVATGLLPPGSLQRDLYPDDDTEGLRRLRRARAEDLGRVIPLIMSLVAPGETTVRGKVGTPEEIDACIDMIRRRYRELVGRDAKVRFYDHRRPDYWPHASAALALDAYLASPLWHEGDRAMRELPVPIA
ncbi:ROK family protein [Occultella glacieicola]|uniref:ROK family protein n=1 Tax=Occultella glacieicola TaxID=2518684 RepID=A0ABY2E0R5_9MICO|nr:ROK family protein [Occultella glacieicola]TDE91539.1 ROK family protein [Occultella glacieicola]